MNRIWKYGLLLAGILAASVAVHQLIATESTGVFYRVSGGKSTVYILGSIHVGNRDMYPFSHNIQHALREADTVVFECDTTSENSTSAIARFMQSETDLKERISPESFHLVERAAEELDFSMETLRKLDPWAVTNTLTVATAAKEMNGRSTKTASSFGVENMVRKQLKDQKIEYLETVDEQLGLMEGFSSRLQEYLLVDACRAVLETSGAKGRDQTVENWPEWWREGKADAFAEAYLREMEAAIVPDLAKEYHQALLVERNHRMAEKIVKMLEDEQKKQCVVVVGLMHLVLETDSILRELEQAGYFVEKVES